MTFDFFGIFFGSTSYWWLPLAALLLDLIFADPRFSPHPVQGIGYFLSRCSQSVQTAKNKRLAGGLVTLLVVGGCFFIVAATLCLPFPFSTLAALYWSWSGLALGGLLRAGGETVRALDRSIDDGRKAVGSLVSRDVGNLDEQGIYKSLAESMSENLNDAFVAPFFWLILGGPAALWAYKAVSTMDSSWGYKNDRWIDAGAICARVDDIVAYIPARLSSFFIYVTMRLMPRVCSASESVWPGWGVVSNQAGGMESPNAGWPMAAAAWAHDGAMGGETSYDGVMKQKPILGPKGRLWNKKKIIQLIIHMGIAGIFGAFLLFGMSLIVMV